MNHFRSVLLLGLALQPGISFATTAVAINSSTLASYDIESADLTPQTLATCPEWTYNSTGPVFLAPDRSSSYYYVKRTTLTVTTKATSTAPAQTLSFPVACDGYDVPEGITYNASLFTLSESLANMETGQQGLSQACTKSVSCGVAGAGPCVTIYGTQTQGEEIVVQLDAQANVIGWQDELSWGACN